MSAAVNTLTTKAGKVRPVCQTCGRRGRAVAAEHDGRIHLWELGAGWSVAPYPADVEHADGSTGSTYTCPACDRRLMAGEALTVDLARR